MEGATAHAREKAGAVDLVLDRWRPQDAGPAVPGPGLCSGFRMGERLPPKL